MAIGVNSLLEVSLSMQFYGQQVMNVWQYEVDTWPAAVGAVAVGEAWWAHVQTAYRAAMVTSGARIFDSVIVRELNNPTGELAEYSIPSASSDGTRAAGTLGSFLASFNAVGVRLTVGTRATRSGQKRFVGLTEGDVAGNDVSATFIGLIDTLMDIMVVNLTLGAPAALTVLAPVVCRKDTTGAVIASQPVLGHVINPYVTTQNSRKYGRGS